jgi:hypothetical protein
MTDIIYLGFFILLIIVVIRIDVRFSEHIKNKMTHKKK